MNKITIVKNPYEVYDFISNIERIVSFKQWGINGVTILMLSSVLNSSGKPYWNYFGE
jgi:hypothetical protein